MALEDQAISTADMMPNAPPPTSGANMPVDMQQEMIAAELQKRGMPMTAENLNRAAHFLYSGEWSGPSMDAPQVAPQAAPSPAPAPAAAPAAPVASPAPAPRPAPMPTEDSPITTEDMMGPEPAPAPAPEPVPAPVESTPPPATSDETMSNVPFVPPVVARRPVEEPAMNAAETPAPKPPQEAPVQAQRPKLQLPERQEAAPTPEPVAPKSAADNVAPGDPDASAEQRQVAPDAPVDPTRRDPQTGATIDSITGDPATPAVSGGQRAAEAIMSAGGLPEGTSVEAVPTMPEEGRFTSVRDYPGYQAVAHIGTNDRYVSLPDGTYLRVTMPLGSSGVPMHEVEPRRFETGKVITDILRKVM